MTATSFLVGFLLAELYAIEPARVFDGESLHSGWRVVVRGERIEAAGPAAEVPVPAGAERIALGGATLLPGLIEAHSHVLLHAYDEASWNDQVLKEPRSLRVARATNHLRDTLLAGFTTIRDLGTEGALYDDVGLKRAIEEGILVGRGCWSRPGRSSQPEATVRRGSIPSGRSRSGPSPRTPTI